MGLSHLSNEWGILLIFIGWKIGLLIMGIVLQSGPWVALMIKLRTIIRIRNLEDT